MAMQPEEQLERSGEGNPIKDALGRKRIEELKALAKDHNVDISGLHNKKDIVDALALHPGIASIVGVSSYDGEVPSLEEILNPSHSDGAASLDTPLLTVAEEPRVVREEVRGPKGFEDLLSESLASNVDFSRMQALLKEAGGKFQARNYDHVLSVARDAVVGIDDVSKRYMRTAWAYAISASLKIIEDSEKGSEPYRRAWDTLEEAKRTFTAGNYITDGRLLEKLHKNSIDLYNFEIQKARQHIQSQEAALEQIQAMGGDTSKASEVLGKAAEAIMAGDRARYLEIITKADDLVTQARNARIGEIRGAFTGVESTIKEAKAIGADTTEALQLLEQSRSSIQGGDFVNANKLISRTERVALEAQKAQIDRVTELHRRQVEKVKKLIVDTKPLLERARAKGQDTSKAMELLRQAVECVNHGDYVNGLLRIKEAAELVKSVVSADEVTHAAPPAAPEPVVMEEPARDAPAPEPMMEIPMVEAPQAPPITAEASLQTPTVETGKGSPRCPFCGSPSIELKENGKGRCFQCNGKFRWGRR